LKQIAKDLETNLISENRKGETKSKKINKKAGGAISAQLWKRPTAHPAKIPKG
jgi:hypothetical protein